MKRFLKYLIVGMSLVAAVPFVNARPGGGGAPMQQNSGHWGGSHGGGFHGGGRFGHDRFRGRSDFFFFGAFPLSYPYYGSPYYYDYPPPYYYYDDYYAPRYYYDYSPSASYDSQTPVYRVDDTRSYLVLGHDSGRALKKKAVTWNWYVEYLRAYILNAPSWARDDFQRGFISGYGDKGEDIYKKGIEQARQPTAPRSENAPSSEPKPDSQQ